MSERVYVVEYRVSGVQVAYIHGCKTAREAKAALIANEGDIDYIACEIDKAYRKSAKVRLERKA